MKSRHDIDTVAKQTHNILTVIFRMGDLRAHVFGLRLRWRLATLSPLSSPSLFPAATTNLLPFPCSIHFSGPSGSEAFGGNHFNTLLTSGSSLGCMPCWYSNSPPNLLAIFSISTYFCSVGKTSEGCRMCSFLTVLASTHLLIQPKTVGKKEGAPMTWYMAVSQGLKNKM